MKSGARRLMAACLGAFLVAAPSPKRREALTAEISLPTVRSPGQTPLPNLRAPHLPADVLHVPVVFQATHYSCGAAALLAILYYWRAYDNVESDLYPLLGTTPQDGTEPPKIVEVARQYGLKAALREGLTAEDLRASLKRGETVILDIQAWRSTEAAHIPWKDTWEEGHYAVLVGMDASNVYLMDPSAAAAYAYLPLSELDERWHDYEDRHGFIRRYHRLGIVISGKSPLKSFPADLIRVE